MRPRASILSRFRTQFGRPGRGGDALSIPSSGGGASKTKHMRRMRVGGLGRLQGGGALPQWAGGNVGTRARPRTWHVCREGPAGWQGAL